MAKNVRIVGTKTPLANKGVFIQGGSLAIDVARRRILKNTFPVKSEAGNVGSSMLGTDLHDVVYFGEVGRSGSDSAPLNKYTTLAGEEITYDAIRFDDAVLNINNTRNIVKDNPQGRNGSIKQYISDGDYIITFFTRITGRWNGKTWERSPGVYPEEELNQIMTILKATSSVPVASKILNRVLGINEVVIENYTIRQVEGFRDMLELRINMLSDYPSILTLTEQDVNEEDKLNNILNV